MANTIELDQTVCLDLLFRVLDKFGIYGINIFVSYNLYRAQLCIDRFWFINDKFVLKFITTFPVFIYGFNTFLSFNLYGAQLCTDRLWYISDKFVLKVIISMYMQC